MYDVILLICFLSVGARGLFHFSFFFPKLIHCVIYIYTYFFLPSLSCRNKQSAQEHVQHQQRQHAPRTSRSPRCTGDAVGKALRTGQNVPRCKYGDIVEVKIIVTNLGPELAFGGMVGACGPGD